MRIRAFALLTLVGLGLVPIGIFAYISIERSGKTAIAEVRQGNERLAHSIAGRISAYADTEKEMIEALGIGILGATDPEAQRDRAAIDYRHYNDLSVYDVAGTRIAGPGLPSEHGALVTRALAGEVAYAPIAPAAADSTGGFAHTQALAVPIIVAGKQRGAVAARVDLVYVWKPVNHVRFGRSGFARLIAFDGTLLAHGNPEERRYVFAGDLEQDSAIIAGALSHQVVENLGGEDVVAAMAIVPGRDWMVVVEEPVAAAFAATRAMQRDLVLFGGGFVALVMLCGVVFGRRTVRELERLRDHTSVLAGGDLDARVATRSKMVEVRALATSLNDMAASIKTLHEEARAQDRLSTFARVAAGLAHDLRQPIEAVRTACVSLSVDPDDAGARELFDWMTKRELPRLKRYVDDLQRIAHEGNVQLDYGPIEPRALATEIADDLRNNPKWGGLSFEAAGEAASLIADSNLVRRAVYNLAANAADACVTRGPGGRVVIEVADVDDGATCELRVRDNGGGIAPDALARLLRGDFHSTKRSSGVGLGFGVARHVAQSHGGAIAAESDVGVGSTFALRLPRQATQPREPAPGGDQACVGPTSTLTH